MVRRSVVVAPPSRLSLVCRLQPRCLLLLYVPCSFVHETNVDYCSTQSLPNCRGWNLYQVNASGTNFTMDTAFHAWYQAITADWEAVMAAREAFREEVVLPSIEQGLDLAAVLAQRGLIAAGAPASRVDLDRGVVQIIDANVWPNNPSCPFPAPA